MKNRKRTSREPLQLGPSPAIILEGIHLQPTLVDLDGIDGATPVDHLLQQISQRALGEVAGFLEGGVGGQAPASGILHVRPAIVLMSMKSMSQSVEEYAGILAHEACHAFIEGKMLSKLEKEKECVEYQCKILKRLGVEEAGIESVRKSLETEYWNVPIFKRWW